MRFKSKALLFLSLLVCAVIGRATHAHDHDHGPIIGPNGVKMKVLLRIEKLKTDSDSGTLIIDLGANKYDSQKPDMLISERPLVFITIGVMPTQKGSADAKAQILGTTFKGKLVKKGAGLKIDFKKAAMNSLLSLLSNKPEEEHLHLTVTITDDVATGGTSSPRILFTDEFEMEANENDKKLIAKSVALAEEEEAK
jgi:hypothetical protein